MKTIQLKPGRAMPMRPLFFSVVLAILSLLPGAQAVIPEPDNVVYGRITVGSTPVAATRTNLVVEVRRTNSTNTDYVVLSSYRMGDNPALSNYYAVTIGLDSVGASSNPLTSFSNATLVIVVKEAVGPNRSRITNYYTTSFTVGGRGFVSNLDFGTPSGFGTWEAANGLRPGSATLDADGDGISNTNEYILGTSPLNATNPFALAVQQADPFTNSITRYTNAATRWTNVIVGLTNVVEISFLARAAEGICYPGLVRYFALENATNPDGPWESMAGFDRLTGGNQLVRYLSTVTNYFDEGTNFIDLRTNYLVSGGLLIPSGSVYLQLDTNFFSVNITNRLVTVKSNPPPVLYRARVWLGP